MASHRSIFVLQSERLDLRTPLRIDIHVVDALASLHNAGILHEDIKPHNILVRLAPLEVTLGDFGIAARLSRARRWIGSWAGWRRGAWWRRR